MARGDRLAKLDERRVELEAEYRAALLAALRETAAGRWGLFGHGKDKWTIANAAPVVESLTEMGEAIDGMRETLGIAPFALHADFVASRGAVKSHAAGEPKQAQAWLARLDADTAA